MKHRNFVDLLQDHADRFPMRVAYTYLRDGEDDGSNLTYGTLCDGSPIAGELARRGRARNERALLIYPSGLEFIEAFFGALSRRVDSVLSTRLGPRDPNTPCGAFRGSFATAAGQVLTCESLRSTSESICASTPELRDSRLSITDRLQDEAALLSPATATSRSSSTPGRPETQRRSRESQSAARERQDDRGDQPDGAGRNRRELAPPLYHDMGLIGGVLSTCFAGARLSCCPRFGSSRIPADGSPPSRGTERSLLRRPILPELCVEKVTEEPNGLDLRSWRVAFNGATHPGIDHRSLHRSVAMWVRRGFHALLWAGGGHAPGVREPLGHARASIASAGRRSPAPRSRPARWCGRRRALRVGWSGRGWRSRSWIRRPGESSGRKWARSGSRRGIASDYWGSPGGVETGFGAKVPSRPGRSFLRTGDLASSDKELFVTGRLGI